MNPEELSEPCVFSLAWYDELSCELVEIKVNFAYMEGKRSEIMLK